jgi:hypothetical protein
MDAAAREAKALEKLRPAGRSGSSLFAMACVERLRPLLRHVPSGSPALVAGTALTELWRVLEGLQRPDPRRLAELSQACWVLVEIEPAPGVPAAYLEMLVAATHHALETYLSGNPQQAIHAASKAGEAASLGGGDALLAEERARQDRDLAEIAELVRAGGALGPSGKQLRARAETEGAKFVEALLG